MIQVTISQSNNQITAFEISGHADSGPYGYDLVCAGVSAVVFGAVNAVEELCDLELDIQQGIEGGYLHVEIPGSLSGKQEANIQLLLQSMLISLKNIEREYGEFIQLQY